MDDKSIKVGGKDGLAYIKTLGRSNDQELETYTHVFFTSPDTWEPSLLDHEFSPEDELSRYPNFRIPGLSMITFLMLKVL